MLGIFAKTMMTATRTEDRPQETRKTGREARRSWLEEDLPFLHHAGQRKGYHD